MLSSIDQKISLKFDSRGDGGGGCKIRNFSKPGEFVVRFEPNRSTCVARVLGVSCVLYSCFPVFRPRCSSYSHSRRSSLSLSSRIVSSVFVLSAFVLRCIVLCSSSRRIRSVLFCSLLDSPYSFSLLPYSSHVPRSLCLFVVPSNVSRSPISSSRRCSVFPLESCVLVVSRRSTFPLKFAVFVVLSSLRFAQVLHSRGSHSFRFRVSFPYARS